MPAVLRRRRSQGRPRQRAYEADRCERLHDDYRRAQSGMRRFANQPRKVLMARESAEEALVVATNMNCPWIRRLARRGLHGLAGRETVTCRRLKRRFRTFRNERDKPGMVGVEARARKLRCEWVAAARNTRRGF